MSDDANHLRDLLSCHGADTGSWPADAQAFAQQARHRPELAALIEEEMRFERILLHRHVPTPPRDLAQRIIAASLARPQDGKAAQNHAGFRPVAYAAMLVIGFFIGFGMPPSAPHRVEAAAHLATDDEGALL